MCINHIIVTYYFPTYLKYESYFLTELVTKVKPNINPLEVSSTTE
jgi:hypothetical protein